MSAGLSVGASWGPVWDRAPGRPYATMQCSLRRAARVANQNGRPLPLPITARRRAAAAAGGARLEREVALVAGDQVPVPPLGVLISWVDAHHGVCDRPWALCLDRAVGLAEAEQRPLAAGDLHQFGALPALRRWSARRAPLAVPPAQRWAGPERTAWHEAGHALFAWSFQDRYEVLLLDAGDHLGGFDRAAAALSPAVVPVNHLDGTPAWSPGQIRNHQLWLCGGMAAEELFVPAMVPAGDDPPFGRQYPGQCNVLHLREAADAVSMFEPQVVALAHHLLAHGGAARRHLRATLGPTMAQRTAQREAQP